MEEHHIPASKSIHSSFVALTPRYGHARLSFSLQFQIAFISDWIPEPVSSKLCLGAWISCKSLTAVIISDHLGFILQAGRQDIINLPCLDMRSTPLSMQYKISIETRFGLGIWSHFEPHTSLSHSQFATSRSKKSTEHIHRDATLPIARERQ